MQIVPDILKFLCLSIQVKCPGLSSRTVNKKNKNEVIMAATIDYQLRDAEALIATVNANLSDMKLKGFTDYSLQQLTELTQNLRLKEGAQQKAVELVSTKTLEQEEVVQRITELIKKIRNAEKSAYGKDEKMQKLFKGDQKIPASIGKLSSFLEYLTGLMLEEHDTMLANGLTNRDIEALNGSYGTLIAANASKENALKLQKSATIARDEFSEKLKDRAFRIRNFAKVCFAEKKEILLQFKAISKGGGGRVEEEKPDTTKPGDNESK